MIPENTIANNPAVEKLEKDYKVENEEAKRWSLATMRTIIIDPKNEEELKDQYNKWINMNYGDRRQSDWKSKELYGKTNKERYEEMLSAFLTNDIKVPLVDKEYTADNENLKNQPSEVDPVKEGASLERATYIISTLINSSNFEGEKAELDVDNDDITNMIIRIFKDSTDKELKRRIIDSNIIDIIDDSNINEIIKEEVKDDYVNFDDINYPDYAPRYAEDWSKVSMIPIIKPANSLEDLENNWNEFNSEPINRRYRSDEKSMELFGIDNKTHYEYLKSKFLKTNIDTNLDSDKYKASSDISSTFIESVCNSIKSSTSKVDKIKGCLKLASIKERTFHENILVQNTIDTTIELFQDNICDTDDYTPNSDMPFYSPDELISFGVFAGDDNRYSKIPDNDHLDDEIRTVDWFNNYQMLFNGAYTEQTKYYTTLWIDKLNQLYYDYDRIKESGDINKINARKQSILELGWNPNLEFTLENRIKANNRIKTIIENNYTDTEIIDVSEFVNHSIEKEELITESTFGNELQPLFLLFSKTDGLFNTIVRKVTKGPGHVAVGFDSTLRTMYSYNIRNNGFTTETLDEFKDAFNIKVYCILLRKNAINRIKNNIRYFMRNKEKTGYSLLNIFSILLKIDYRSKFNMVCSQFVDGILKLADIDLTNKASSLVSPKDLYSKIIRNKRIYKVYDGVSKNYNAKKVRGFLSGIVEKMQNISEFAYIETELAYLEALSENMNDSGKLQYLISHANINNIEYNKIYNNMIKPYIDMVPIKETKDFPVQFDEEGNLLIEKMNELDFEAEFSKSHKLLLAYEKTENLEGIKYELCKLWFMNQLLEKKIYDKKTKKDDLAKYNKARAKILNDFNKYINLVSSKDNSFNFVKYYEETPFNDTKIKVKSSTLKYTIKYIKSILLPG